MKNRWLLKTEPEEYSWKDLVTEGETAWNGIKAFKALANLAKIKPEDLVFVYHTGKERAIVGIANVISFPYPDPGQADDRSIIVKIAPLKVLPSPVTLRQIKESGLFPEWELVRLPRLSVMPVSDQQWEKVMEWGGLSYRTRCPGLTGSG